MRAAILFLFSILTASLSAQDMPKNQVAKSFKASATHELALQYLLFLPKGYDENGSKKWPLMLFLHGAGERGTNLNKVTVHGPPKIVKNQTDFPFVLVSPQCPSGQTWDDETVLALLDDVIKTYKIDPRRVYLTGLSMGGFGTWSLAINHPDRFAAVAPICGGGSTINILLPGQGKQSALRNLPIWAFHGAKDPVVKLYESERMVEAFKAAGNTNVQLTVYPEAGHDSWTETYNNDELYKWFLRQSRTSTNRKQ